MLVGSQIRAIMNHSTLIVINKSHLQVVTWARMRIAAHLKPPCLSSFSIYAKKVWLGLEISGSTTSTRPSGTQLKSFQQAQLKERLHWVLMLTALAKKADNCGGRNWWLGGMHYPIWDWGNSQHPYGHPFAHSGRLCRTGASLPPCSRITKLQLACHKYLWIRSLVMLLKTFFWPITTGQSELFSKVTCCSSKSQIKSISNQLMQIQCAKAWACAS